MRNWRKIAQLAINTNHSANQVVCQLFADPPQMGIVAQSRTNLFGGQSAVALITRRQNILVFLSRTALMPIYDKQKSPAYFLGIQQLLWITPFQMDVSSWKTFFSLKESQNKAISTFSPKLIPQSKGIRAMGQKRRKLLELTWGQVETRHLNNC